MSYEQEWERKDDVRGVLRVYPHSAGRDGGISRGDHVKGKILLLVTGHAGGGHAGGLACLLLTLGRMSSPHLCLCDGVHREQGVF